ncbi:MAG: hypothetical protein JO104_11025 [Candidatus Eremiobacteraeota bacterium]|nr:hypothetical protein [Candidatus Eremiobacteraeota bacterium]
MPAALFESEPQASAAATVLRELGFESEVVVRGDSTFGERIRDFFAGNAAGVEPHALLISNDADDERFVRTVQRHYGVLVRDV